MINKISLGTTVSPMVFFGYLFSIRDIVHLTHLKQPDRTLATHEALNDLYEGLLPLIDSLIEDFQGIYGIQSITIPETSASSKPIEVVKSCYDYIQSNRTIFKESWIQNILDEMCELIAKTLYKLKFVSQ